MPAVLDPRRVEPRFRIHAAIVCALLVSSLLVYVLSMAIGIVYGHPTVEVQIEEDWGNFPDLGVCSFVDYDTKFAFWNFYASNRMLHGGLGNSVAKGKPPYIKAKVGHIVDVERDLFSNCFLFETSMLVPQPRMTTAFTLKASFERKRNESAKEEWIEDTRSSLSVVAYAGGKWAGKLGEIVPYRADSSSAIMTSFEIQKTRIHTLRGFENCYFEAVSHPLALETPIAPRVKVASESDLGDLVSSLSDPLSDKLLVATFEILLLQTNEHLPPVRSLYYKSLWVKLAALLGGTGGLFTLGIVLFRVCFPRKYPISNLCATTEMRTLRGYSSSLREVLVDGASCEFGSGCVFTSSMTVGTHTSQAFATTELASLRTVS